LGPFPSGDDARPGGGLAPPRGLGLHKFTRMSANRAIEWVEQLELSETERQIARLILCEIDERQASRPGPGRHPRAAWLLAGLSPSLRLDNDAALRERGIDHGSAHAAPLEHLNLRGRPRHRAALRAAARRDHEEVQIAAGMGVATRPGAEDDDLDGRVRGPRKETRGFLHDPSR
jgi:hypothetical protein